MEEETEGNRVVELKNLGGEIKTKEKTEEEMKTAYERSLKNNFLDEIPVACPHCGECCHHEVIDNFINYNQGDSIIDPHVHLNIVFKCKTCEHQFALRAHVNEENLYYGDLNDGHIEDMGANTQEILREGGVLDGFFSEYRGREDIENYPKRGEMWTSGDKKRVWGNLFLDDGYYICVVKTLEKSLHKDDDKQALKSLVEMIGVERREIWEAANKMLDDKPTEEIFTYLKEEAAKIVY